MDASEEVCGEVYGGLSIVGKIALLAQWAPMLAKLEAVAVAKTPTEKAVAIIAALRMAADSTTTSKDNDVLTLIEAVIKTPEGLALVNWFALVAQEIK
jgi:uncharacterized protein YfdQ (DUF2303 family)